MAIIRLHIRKDKLEAMDEQKLHSVPCKIHGDEAASVKKYFEPYIRKINDKHFQTSFRGYPLEGIACPVPGGYTGITFYEHKKPAAQDTERNLYSTGIFKEFIYWNYDKTPSKNDSLLAALDWIDIAEALHAPVEDENT